MNNKIPFNKPHVSGNETSYIIEAIDSGKISGNGQFTQRCHSFFEKKYNFKKALLTSSCTDALEMAAILANIQPDDEVIVPSYTFVSSALAFVRQGAKIVFADCHSKLPNLDTTQLGGLISAKTKAIVVVHYAGIACDMDEVMVLADKHQLLVIEDAAQCFDSFYKGRPLGGIGHFGCFSFHETKNIQCGEGGMLVVNDDRFIKRSEIIWEKGTNRAEFFRGEVNKYGWVDTGSSFLPSEISAAFLYAQLESSIKIQNKRKQIWTWYKELLEPIAQKGYFTLPSIPEYASNNAHMFYLTCNSLEDRIFLITYLKTNGIMAVFHYISLHSSPYYQMKHDGRTLKNADFFTDCLVRLPLFYELTFKEVRQISNLIKQAYFIRHLAKV